MKLVFKSLALVALSIVTQTVIADDKNILGSAGKMPISIDLRDTAIHNVLRIFAETTNLNIVAAPAVTGKVRNLQLKDVPAEQAFATVLRLYGLYAVREGNVIIVYPVTEYLNDATKRQGT